jgi:RimJ/RimL family protein N-acetyltransferase
MELTQRPLVSQRTILEPITPSMHRKLFRAVEDSRPFLEPWLPWVPFNDSVEASLRYADACETDWRNGTALRFSIRLRDQPDLVGAITLESISDLHRSGDLGYWLRPTVTGRGLMTEAGTLLLDFAYSKVGFHRIRCAAATENIKSQKVIERLGFQKEGLARDAERVAGRWVTHVVYARLAEDPPPPPSSVQE